MTLLVQSRTLAARLWSRRPAALVLRGLSETAATSPLPPPPKIHLFQYHICPFCNRVKALLDYANMTYSTTEVNPLTKAEIKQFKGQHTKVPIATLQHNSSEEPRPLFGSDVIVEELLKEPAVQQNLEKRQQTLSDFAKSENAERWTKFAVDKLAVLLYPNMCKTWGDSYRAFDYINRQPEFSTVQKFMIQNIGSLAMNFAASKVKKKHNIQDEQKALEDVLTELDANLEQHSYLSKTDRPDLGDLMVFGTLRAIDGLPVHERLVVDRGGSLKAWYERMKEQVATN